MENTLSTPARLFAGLVALTGWAALGTQLYVSSAEHGGLGPALWELVRYFTILTNFAVAVAFSAMALRARALSPGWLGGLTLWILIVGIVYHLLLAKLYDPQGLTWWANHGLHTAVPTLVALWWLLAAPKRGLGLRHAAAWLAWPLAYVAYALIRSPLEGKYPYFFIDVSKLGIGQVALNSAGLCLAFFLGGLAIVAIARLLSR